MGVERKLRKRLVELVIDRRLPDGSTATDDQIADAIHLALERDEELCALLCVAKFGRRIDGEEVGWDERESALDELAKLAATTWERPLSPVGDEDGGVDMIAMAEDLFEDAEAGHREARRELADHHLGHRRALKELDPAVEHRRRVDARAVLEEAVRDLGGDPATVLRPLPRGRLPVAEHARRHMLAHAVARARAAGAQLDEIGTVIGISKQRVSDLARWGATLAQ